jgi:putative phosphoribosyl transferase
VIVVRKLGVPFQPELGMGAVGEGGVRIVDREIVRRAGVSERELSTVEQRERVEVACRASRLRGDKTPVPLTGRTVIVVDDGMATGSTARAACHVARAQGATRVVVAVPVGPEDTERRMRGNADEIICLYKPVDFFAVGQFYDRFDQTIDREVVELLRRASERVAAVSAAKDRVDPSRDKE